MRSGPVPLLVLAGLLVAAHGQASGPRQDFQVLRGQAAAWLESLAMKTYPDSQARVSVGPVDERLRLAACPEPRFFLPQGGRPWGNGSVGARCEAPARWSLYLSFQAALRGPALAAVRPLPARAVPGPGDLELRLVDFQQDPDRYLREFPAGARLLRPLAGGQPLILGMVEQPDVIRAGEKVRVTAAGAGFQVAQEGTALGRAAPGEAVKVKMPSGRIVQGTASREGLVQVAP